MADERVSIEVLEAVTENHATCVVRCLAGVVSVGHVFDTWESPDGEVVEVSLAVDSIWRYGKEVRFFDSAHTARLELTGQGPTLLAENGYLATRSPTPHP